jgi:NADPH-dependent 2,4-dienoyl-CoA reductase/sulfur reductase-like enzyme
MLNEVIPWLLKEGVDAISVSDGGVLNLYDLSFTIQPLYYSRGCIVDHAERVKKRVRELGYDIPVGAVGKIMDPKLAEKIVEEGIADFIKLGRVSWADPEFPRKAMEGRYEDIRPCLSCDFCTWFLFLRLPCRCAVNWEFDRPFHQRKLEKTKEPKNIVVVGGIAGMEFARVATLRGHKVTILEKRDRLGGLINIAANIPNVPTGDLIGIAIYLQNQVRKLGIEVK